MSNTKQVIIRSGLGFVALLSLFLSGCVELETLPPTSYAVKVPGVIGSFYSTIAQGIRKDVRITYSENRAIPYLADGGLKDDGTPDHSKFQLYKIGNAYWGYAKSAERKLLFRLYVTKTQLVFYLAKPEFFAKNPNALPGTQVGEYDAVIKCSPKQLVAFLNLHANTKELLDMDNPGILNRIGT